MNNKESRKANDKIVAESDFEDGGDAGFEVEGVPEEEAALLKDYRRTSIVELEAQKCNFIAEPGGV